MIDFEMAPSGFNPWSSPPVAKNPAFVDALNARQREAVLHTEGPLIVIAGAGSGKTKMLTSRIAYLVETGRARPYEILAMTFTNKAAGEMRERVERTLAHAGAPSNALGTPEIGTFHSVCVRLLRREAAATPFTKPFVIYDDSDQLSLIKTAMQKLAIDDKAFSPKSIQGAINRAKCDALEPQDMEPSAHDIHGRQVKRVYEQYQKDLFSNNALDFSEILCLTYRLLRDNLALRQKYQRRYRYIHVDEYQDTNRAQYLMLNLLANPKQGGHGNICVVGDEDQSIYKWRGADIKNILDFETDYPGAHVVKLEQNYRSTQTIIEAAGHVIRNNTTRKDKTLWTENEKGIPLVRAQLPDERAEAELVIREIKRLAQSDQRAYSDFAIFYRTNAQSRQFEDVLRREKIAYQVVGGLRFYDRKEIKDVLSYFKMIINPSDSVSAKRIINVPARGIGKTTIEKLETHHQSLENAGEGKNFWDALGELSADPKLTSAATARKITQFVNLMNKLMQQQPKLLLSELYHLILDETAYVAELRKEATEEALARVENLEEFDTLLLEFEEIFFEAAEKEKGSPLTEEERLARYPELLPQFIEQSALASDADSKENSAPMSAVKMMTLHSSKGLEFPVVFLVGMEEGLFPSIKPWEETADEDIEEERRLCYVGMTRARENLYLLNAVVRRIWGNVAYNDPSRFFLEIPDRYVDFRDLSRSSGYSGGHSYGPRIGGSGSSSGSGFGSAKPISTGNFDASKYGSAGSGGYGGVKKKAVSDSDFGDDEPAYREAPTSREEWIGQRIDHPEYGSGTVIAVDGSGDDRRVTIEFRGRQQRKFLARYLTGYLE